jgi:putative AlgH/UPF0301 family transcriptional regulator
MFMKKIMMTLATLFVAVCASAQVYIGGGDWLVCDADMDLIFNIPYDDRWDAAYKKLGLDRTWLSSEIGHA